MIAFRSISSQNLSAVSLCPVTRPWHALAVGPLPPSLVGNESSGRVYIFVDDSSGLQRYKSRAWCRLEALCAACPHQPSQVESAFSPKVSRVFLSP